MVLLKLGIFILTHVTIFSIFLWGTKLEIPSGFVSVFEVVSFLTWGLPPKDNEIHVTVCATKGILFAQLELFGRRRQAHLWPGICRARILYYCLKFGFGFHSFFLFHKQASSVMFSPIFTSFVIRVLLSPFYLYIRRPKTLPRI